jgi:uncharacterized short protein YbdD (DUF466 family)
MTAPTLDKARHLLQQSWLALRELTGDDGYERYLAHHAQAHPGEPPLDRARWFKQEQHRKWNGVRRCC